MAHRSKQHKKTARKGKKFPLLFWLGLGLIVLGITTAIYLPQKQAEPAFKSAIPVTVNYPAPQVALSDLSGRTDSLENHRGEVVLLNNWATWCPPCKAEMPFLQTFYQSHQSQGFTVIGVEAGEPHDEVQQFVSSHNLTFPIWLDPQNLSLSSFHVTGLPSSFVIDRSGTVRLAWSGAISLDVLEQFVSPLIEE